MIGRICGTGSYIPELVWDNNKLAEMVETSDEWIQERTGVKRRHIAGENETTAMFASKAAEAALKDAGITPEEVDLIIVATLSSNEVMPTASCEVQKYLGADNATCFDLNAACTGFLFALNTAQAYIAQGIYKTVVIVGAESLSNLTNWNDRGTCILFGDGAGAVVVQAQEEGSYSQVTHSVGKQGEVLTCSSRNQKKYIDNPEAPETYMQMNGQEVFKFAVSKVPEVIKELLNKEQLTTDDIQYFILHQANMRIVASVAKRLKESMDKFPTNMDEYGNTSSASIPILLDELNKKGTFQRGDRLVMSGFGAGLSYGASLITW